ncbi:hypothetical protein V5799_011396 [Amblyomma americanum]|uniref:Uncharacterized protein n=1 Tax=Amblyomma americanum TaxID=6943 RepID=A0AAQ4EH80_AMBAM
MGLTMRVDLCRAPLSLPSHGASRCSVLPLRCASDPSLLLVPRLSEGSSILQQHQTSCAGPPMLRLLCGTQR